jgi:hypothetical protein
VNARARAWIGPALFALAALCGCELFAGKGGGTETESKVVAGRAVNADGSPAALARVTLRPADYLADLVSKEKADPGSKDTLTDAHGRFSLGELPTGSYRIEIAGNEARGSIHDFSVTELGKGLMLPADTLEPRGSISGSFAPDSESQLASFVQVYGMERLVKADPAGNFILYNLPPGDYDVRCSSLQPFRREAVRMGIRVQSGKQTAMDAVVLEKEAKLAFRIDSTGLQILGLDSTNPVIIDNERWDNGPDNEYFWAKASLGAMDLRGNIVTNDHRNGSNILDTQLKKGMQELREARLAGFTSIPDLVAGARTRLAWPASGKFEDIPAVPSAGSDLIVAEARKATPEKPLLVVVGGPLSTVAQAWLTDPGIATRMVVAGVYSYNLQGYDTVANYLVARKCRFVQWGRNYTWLGNPDTSRVKEIPLSRMGERTRAFLAGAAGRLSLGDIAPAAFLYRRSLWKSADMVKVSRTIEVRPASDITFDFLDIPEGANDWQPYQDEYYATLSDPRAYHPIAVPGRVEAEAFLGMDQVAGLVIDSIAGTEGCGYAAGSWSEYKLASAAAGDQKATVRYRSGGGAKLSFSQGAGAVLAELVLPPSADWAEADLPALTFLAGTQVLRVTVSGGSCNLDWLDFQP